MFGARSRLLPPSVPFRFFAAAIVFHAFAWLALAVGADVLHGFMGGPGPVLASLHLLTLGVLAMIGMGAAYQLLPVATKRPVRSVRLCLASFWLMLPGVALFGYGLGHAAMGAMHGGATLVVAALAIFAYLIIDNLGRVKDMPMVVGHAWLAVASLLVLTVLGVLLVVDFTAGFLPDRRMVASAHAAVAGFGFMGMLAMGFSYILVPMFALSQVPRSPAGIWSIWLSGSALLLAGCAAAFGSTVGIVAAVAVGLAAAGLHLRMMALIMAKRMRRDLGGSFILIRTGWVLLPVSMVGGLLLGFGWHTEITAPLFGFLAIFGWLLSFLTGVLQRIMPFLASMHSARPGGKPALVSTLTAAWPLKVHFWCHYAALAGVCVGIVADQPVLIRAGAVAGLAGALAFAVFAALLWQRLVNHLKDTSDTAEIKAS